MIRRQLRDHVPAVPAYLLTTDLAALDAERATPCPLTAKQAVARLVENVAVCPQQGPVSNTGLNFPQSDTTPAFDLCIDYCTLVFSNDKAQEVGQNTRTIVDWLFGHESGLQPTQLRAKQWQFYKLSAYIHDGEGSCVGRIGRGGNGDTWCVSLSGAGCTMVKNWPRVVIQAAYLDAHLSRVDVAFDDFGGLIFGSIRQVNDMAKAGAFAPATGKPPATGFWDDHNSGKGSTVYVGRKGRKQLCVYEKGKQCGDPESPWIRCELRLWAADSVVPLDVLTRPHEFLRGAYDALAERLPLCEETSRPEKTARTVAANAVAVTRFLREQCGPMLQVMWECLGSEFVEFMKDEIFRKTLPSRFKGVTADRESLVTILRTQLGYELAPPF